jgi:class 3 adenylate cyclase
VRPIRFHRPESLSLDDYCYTYLFEPSARLAGFMTARQAMQVFHQHLSTFAPGERIMVEKAADAGLLSCLDLYGGHSFALVAEGEPDTEVQRISAVLTDHGFEVSLPARDPAELHVGGLAYAGTFHMIRPGPLAIEFEQRSGRETALAVVYFPIFGLQQDVVLDGNSIAAGARAADSALNVSFASPRLTAKRLFATQTFHDLFRAQAFRESEGFVLKDTTILFTDLKGSTQLYQRIGDLNAYELVREHYGILGRIVSARHGAVVKTIGDAIMATFDRPSDAVAAGIDMLREVRAWTRSSVHGDLILKIGVHHGAAISVTLNDRIDYFGQTVNIAARVQSSAEGDEMYLTEEMFTAPGVADVLEQAGMAVEELQVPLRGIDAPMSVYRVAGRAA